MRSMAPLLRVEKSVAINHKMTTFAAVGNGGETMAKEYIERGEAIEAIQTNKGYFQDHISTYTMMLKIEAENVLSDLETVDVAPVRHGRWIPLEDSAYEFLCSNCKEYMADDNPNYCPNCGAKMDLEDKNE